MSSNPPHEHAASREMEQHDPVPQSEPTVFPDSSHSSHPNEPTAPPHDASPLPLSGFEVHNGSDGAKSGSVSTNKVPKAFDEVTGVVSSDDGDDTSANSPASLPSPTTPATHADGMAKKTATDEVENADGAPSPSHWYTPVVHVFQQLVPYGGLVSNCFSLGSVTLGGGIIGMAHSFSTSGLVMGILYLVIFATLTVYSLTLMAYAMEKTGCRTFEAMGHTLFGQGWGYFVGFELFLACFGTAIAYISAASSLIYPILQNAPGTPEYLKTTSGNRLITSMIWLVLLVPIIIPKHINSIRYVSAIGVTMVLYFVLTIVIHSSQNGLKLGMRSDIPLFTTGNKAIYGLSIFVFACLCQGVSFSVYFEMQPRPSVRQMTYAAAIAMTFCATFYILAGVFGLLDFGSSVKPSILYNFDPIHQPYMMVAYIGMLVKICAAYAMNMIPLRNFVYHCLRWDLETVPYWKHTIAIVFMSLVVLILGLFIPNINTAFGLVGSLCGGFHGFIFPALFFMYCGNWSLKTVGLGHYVATYFLLVTGVVAICFGTVATLYSSFIDTA